jgi:hypothetical protein
MYPQDPRHSAMHVILIVMVKRLFSLVVALVIGGAPAALEVCQITCESKVAHPARASAAHEDADHHHDNASHGSRRETPPAPHLLQTHPCDHDRAVAEPGVAAGRDSDRVPMPVAVRVPGTDDLAPVRPATLVHAARLTLSGCPEVRFSLPLRI